MEHVKCIKFNTKFLVYSSFAFCESCTISKDIKKWKELKIKIKKINFILSL